MEQEVWDALESTSPFKALSIASKTVATPNEVTLHKNMLLKFLGELPDYLSVRDVIDALENYRK